MHLIFAVFLFLSLILVQPLKQAEFSQSVSDSLTHGLVDVVLSFLFRGFGFGLGWVRQGLGWN